MRYFLISLFLFLNACSGGGGSSSPTPPNNSNPPTPTVFTIKGTVVWYLFFPKAQAADNFDTVTCPEEKCAFLVQTSDGAVVARVPVYDGSFRFNVTLNLKESEIYKVVVYSRDRSFFREMVFDFNLEREQLRITPETTETSGYKLSLLKNNSNSWQTIFSNFMTNLQDALYEANLSFRDSMTVLKVRLAREWSEVFDLVINKGTNSFAEVEALKILSEDLSVEKIELGTRSDLVALINRVQSSKEALRLKASVLLDTQIDEINLNSQELQALEQNRNNLAQTVDSLTDNVANGQTEMEIELTLQEMWLKIAEESLTTKRLERENILLKLESDFEKLREKIAGLTFVAQTIKTVVDSNYFENSSSLLSGEFLNYTPTGKEESEYDADVDGRLDIIETGWM